MTYKHYSKFHQQLIESLQLGILLAFCSFREIIQARCCLFKGNSSKPLQKMNFFVNSLDMAPEYQIVSKNI